MSLESYVVLTHGAAPLFVKDGGSIEYELVLDKKGRETYLIFGSRPDGSRIKCVVTNTGKQKSIKNLTALITFHKSCYPDGTPITVPTIVNEQFMHEVAA